MLCCKPWGLLLPEDARKELPFILMSDNAKANGGGLEGPDPLPLEPGPRVLAQLKKIFDSMDTDYSGELETEEMMHLVEEVWHLNDRPAFGSRADLAEATTTILEKYDIDQNGSISFSEFTQMMGQQPFIKMLPQEARDFFAMKGRELAAEPEQKSAAKAVLIQARNLFKSADLDEDGHLEENELANVMQELHRRQGKKMSGDARMRIVESCREQIKRFDQSGAGVLDFVGFVRMLGQKPWNQVIGEEAAKSIPFLLMNGLKVDVEKNRPEPRQGDELLEFAREIFEKADVDDSGFIDEHELGELLKMIWAKLGKPFGKADKERLRYEVHAAMVNFDVDDSGTISFPEFIMLLSKRPWRLMLPKELQDDILMRGQEVWAETEARNVPEPEMTQEETMNLGEDGEPNEDDYMTEEQFQAQVAAMDQQGGVGQSSGAFGQGSPQMHQSGTQDEQLYAMLSSPQVLQRSGSRGRPGDKYPKEPNRKWPSSLPRPRVYVMKNDGEDPPLMSSPAMVYSIANLLDCASKQLGLARAARRLFIRNTGEEIYYLDQIRNNMELLVSMGEDLKTSARPRSNSPRRSPSPPKLRGTGPAKTFSGGTPWVSSGDLYANTRVGFEARQAQNPRASTNLKIWPQGVKRPRVIVRHNDGGHRSESYPVLVYSMRNLLDEGTKHLGMARCARRIFDLEGHEIFGLEELSNMMEVCLSEGEAFRPKRDKRTPRRSATKRY